MTKSTLIDLHPNEYIEGLRYYPFAVNLYRCMGICDTVNDLSNRTCVPNKREDLNLSVFDLMKTMKSMKNVGESAKIQKNIMLAKKIVFAILLALVLEIVNI